MPRMTRLSALVLLCLLVVGVTPVIRADSYSTFVATPTFSGSSADAAAGYPDVPPAFSSTSIVTTNASTTSVAVTPLAGRKRVKVRLNAVGELWVSVGTTTAVVGGSNCVKIARQTVSTPTQELVKTEEVFEYDANVPMGHIASTAFSITILQEARYKNK